MAAGEGFEPSWTRGQSPPHYPCANRLFLFTLVPVRWLGRRGSNPHDDLLPRQVAFRLAHVPLGCPSSNALDSRGPQPRALLSSSGHTSWSTPRGSNPDEAACRAAALPLVLGVGGSGPGSRTPLGSVMSRPRPRGVRNGLGGAGGSRTRTPRSRTASTHRYCDSAGMVDPEGLEPLWRGQRDSNPYSRADNAASFPSTMSPSRWSRRRDSNPHVHRS